MPIYNGANALLLERSGQGHTATVLSPSEAVMAGCDDAGTVMSADGSVLMTAALRPPGRRHSPRTHTSITVAAADGTPAGTLAVRRYTVTPFSKRLTLALLDPAGAEVGELAPTDRKGRELEVSCGGIGVVSLALAERDRGVRRTVERWALTARLQPPAPSDLLAAAAVLRYGKLLAEVGTRAAHR